MSFDVHRVGNQCSESRFNPFGTGQCLSTLLNLVFKVLLVFQSLWNRAMSFDALGYKDVEEHMFQSLWNRAMSFDIRGLFSTSTSALFQSLWNRAMSFDDATKGKFGYWLVFQSLWNRAMSFDCSRVFEPCVARLPRATSQLFLMFE